MPGSHDHYQSPHFNPSPFDSCKLVNSDFEAGSLDAPTRRAGVISTASSSDELSHLGTPEIKEYRSSYVDSSSQSLPRYNSNSTFSLNGIQFLLTCSPR